MKPETLVDRLLQEVSRISKKVGVHPSLLKKSQFMKESKCSEWQLRTVGGYASLLKTYFPQEDRDLNAIQQGRNQTAYISKLEKQVGNWESFREKFTDSLIKIVSDMRISSVQLDPATTKKHLASLQKEDKKSEVNRSICTIWSDQHFGTNFDKDEMAGINAFNWTIGARRLGLLCDQLATYKAEKRHLHSELVILLIGDNIAGVIHNQEGSQIDLITHQIAGTTSYYVQAIDYLSNFFPKIRVICQPGNHGRVMHKASKDRAMQQKYDSFENIIFYSLSQVFAKNPKVKVVVPKAPYCDVTVQGHRIFATHGDTVFDVGNPGRTIALHRIEEQVNKINAEQLLNNQKPYTLFCTGHVHHPLYTHVGSGVQVVVNGCLIGTDPYALSIGVQSSQPVQVMWETTPHHVLGDVRSVYVASADSETKYDKIIRPYKYELSV